LIKKLLKIDNYEIEGLTYFGWVEVSNKDNLNPKIALNSQTLIKASTVNEEIYMSTKDVDEYIKYNLGIDSVDLIKRFGRNMQNLNNEFKKINDNHKSDDAKFFMDLAKLVVSDKSFYHESREYMKI